MDFLKLSYLLTERQTHLRYCSLWNAEGTFQAEGEDLPSEEGKA